MKKSYWIMMMVVLFLSFLVLSLQAQTVGDIMWEDHFEDTATDSLLLVNPGWFHYGESDGLVNQIVKQMVEEDNGIAYIQTGSYGGLVGAGLIQTNGVPFINPEDTTTATHDSLVANHWSDPNQEITFKMNLFQMSAGGVFIVSTRMPQNDPPDEDFPDSDPTERPGYFLLFNIPDQMVVLGKYPESAGGGQIPILDNSTWTIFGAAAFEPELDVWYWVKYYLYEGEVKAKVWEGEPIDEPEEWLVTGTDPEPRVTGKYTTFASFNGENTGGGDIFKLDDIVVRKIEPPVTIDQMDNTVPMNFELANNYPNPFNPETTIEFSVDQLDQITLEIFSVTGEKVRTLVNKQMPAGTYKIVFDSKNDLGSLLPSGLYFYRIQNSTRMITRKMILMK
jgi:hypothetical protein